MFEKTVSNMQEFAAREGKIILLSDPRGARGALDSLFKLTLPAMPAAVTPLVYAIVQLIAYHTAAAMGNDVDQPREPCQVGHCG